MDEMPVRDRIDCLEPIYRDQIAQVFPTECVVPDTMPDAESILISDGEVFFRSGTLSAGSAVLEGSIQGTIVCTGDKAGAPFRLEVSIPVVMTFQDQEIRDSDHLVFCGSVTGTEARIVNSRKISFRAEVTACIQVLRQNEIDLSADTTGIERTEILPGEVRLGYVTALREKSFTAADELDLSAPVDKLLWYHMELFSENAKKVGAKTILQGGAEVQLIYLTPNSEIPKAESFRIPFSQIMDAPEGEASLTAVVFCPVGCFVDILPGLNQSDTVSIELQLSAQVLYLCEQKTGYIADMYSLSAPLNVQTVQKSFAEPYSASALKVTERELIELPERPAEVISTSIRFSPCVISEKEIRTMASVCILYRADSGLRSVNRKIPVRFETESETKTYAVCSVVCGDIFTSVQSDGILLQFDAELNTVSAGAQSITYICSAAQCESDHTHGERPSITAVRRGGRSLWELAKAYGSTVRLIESANPDSSDTDALLLIPRGR